jgi:3-hydroxybutyryl-CoA dehydratase
MPVSQYKLKDVRSYKVGDEIVGPTRPLTPDRIAWYSIGMLSGAMGSRQPVQHNIHTDDEYAKSQGLPAAIADGMHSTNWLNALMADFFGPHFVAHGELRTKFIKPTYANIPVTPKGKVTGREEQSDGSIKITLDLWMEDNVGTQLTVGDGSVLITNEFGGF